MSGIQYAAVTVLDGLTCVGPLDPTIVVGLDYRYAGALTNQVTYTYANSSIGGAGETIVIQVSPDWRHDAPTNAGAMWATYALLSAAGGAGVIPGPFSAVRAYKLAGGSNAKVVFMAAGKFRNKLDIQG